MPDYVTPNGSHPLDTTPEGQLEQAITALQGEHAPSVPADIAPDDAAALRMAALLRGTLADDAAPDPAFARDLRARLERDLFAVAPAPPPTAPQPRGTSRRGLLRSGLAAAGGLAAGVAGGALLGHDLTAASNPGTSGNVALVAHGAWQTVAHITQVAPGTALRFTTPQVVGHLVRYDDGSFAAFSAACTHMGCIVAWDGTQRTFDCPCHNGRFTDRGQFLSGTYAYRPLPQIQTRVVGEAVQVFLPAPTAPASSAPTPPPSGGYGHEG